MERQQCLSVPQLKERGWTDAIIRKHLGEHDDTRPNPYYNSSPPMRFYLLTRVVAVEEAAIWTALQEKADKRRLSAEQAVNTKKRKLLAHVDSLTISVPAMPIQQATEEACEHYNERKQWEAIQSARYSEWRRATMESDPAFLHRITVNYLRHEFSRYEVELARVFGKVGIADAIREIRRKVYAAIGAAFPDLREECHRQFAARHNEF